MPAPRQVQRIIGVYHASSGLLGELRYVVGSVLGRTHCALCDITHAGFHTKEEWIAMCDSLDLPVECIHLNERDPRMEMLTEDRTPCVLAEVDGELVYLLDPAAITSCRGSVSAFQNALQTSMEDHRLIGDQFA